MVQPDVKPSMRRQCEMLSVCRSSLYYEPEPTSEEQLALMRLIDELHLLFPFYGSRKLALELKSRGHDVNRKRVQRLMRLMGLEAMAPKPNTSRPAPEHPVYPYLLRGLKIHRVNQVWAADITYIPLERGFAYLVAIMDWYSRRVLSWRLSNTLDSSFCVEALEEALSRFGKPEIFNTDQGSQFTSEAFTSVLRKHEINISMDGKGRFTDNIFVERLWRTLKYEEVYLHAYDDVAEARQGIIRFFRFYNERRFHSSLGNQTPAAFYDGLMARAA
jgi:putative transposase